MYNTNERLSFYAMAHVPDYTAPLETPWQGGEPTHPFKKAFTSEEAMTAAMQGLSHDLYNFWPEVVIFVSAFYTAASTFQVVRARKHKIVVIHTESPYQDDEQLVRAQFADVNILNDPVNLEEYQALQPNSYYQPHCYDPAVHFPRKAATDEWPEIAVESDFSFIGTIFKSRKEFFESMLSRFTIGELEKMRVVLGGAGWDNDYMDDSFLLKFLRHPRGECVDNTETAHAYRISRSGINFYRRESEGEHVGEGIAMGPREVEMAACGLPFVRDPRPESDEIFGHILPSFSSPEEAADQLRWLLADEGRRDGLGLAARDAVKNRTFENAAKRLLRHLEK